MEINDLAVDWTYPLGEEHLLEGAHTLAGLLSFTVKVYMYDPFEDSESIPWTANFQLDMTATDLNGVQDPITIENCIESFDFTVEDLDDNDLLARALECDVQFAPGSWQVVGTIAIEASHASGVSTVLESFQHTIEVYESDDATDTGDEG